MTKQELLDQLIGFDWVLLLSGTPELLDTFADTKVYRQNIFEGALDTGTYRNIFFYVYKEGTAQETAMYKDERPAPIISNENDVLSEGIYDYFKAAFPNTPFEVLNPNADLRSAIIRTFIDDPNDAGTKVILAAYSVVETAPSTFSIKQITATDSIIMQLRN